MTSIIAFILLIIVSFTFNTGEFVEQGSLVSIFLWGMTLIGLIGLVVRAFQPKE